MTFSIHSEVVQIQSTQKQVIDWGVSLVQAPQLWSETKGEGMKIAVLDTGVDKDHPDLKPNIKKGMNFTSSNRLDYRDRQGHGTHCAGIIAGCDNEIGVVGVAPKAELYIAKVLGDDGSGTIAGIVKGIEWAISERVDIISMSLGASRDPGSVLHNAIKRARKAGIIIVGATGNENTHVGWPAAYDEVIAVGAIGQDLERADFSNFGKEVAIAAPGVDILSTYPTNQYAKLSGTSMATPMVAGVVALAQAYCRKRGIKATPDFIVKMIRERSVDLGETGTDHRFGNGLVNVYKMIKGSIIA